MCTACFHCDAETWYRVKLFGLIGLVWSGLFALGCVYVRYAVPAHYDANAKHSWNKKTCHVNSYSISTIDPNRRLEALPAAGSSAEAPRRLSDDDADDGSMTYYAVLQVTVSPCPDGLDADKCHEYDTAAVKYPSWAAGSGGSSLHGWVSKRNAKKWAKQYVADTDYTCWKMPGDKRTVSIQNPGYHYRWQVALGAGAMAATAVRPGRETEAWKGRDPGRPYAAGPGPVFVVGGLQPRRRRRNAGAHRGSRFGHAVHASRLRGIWKTDLTLLDRAGKRTERLDRAHP